MTLYEEIKSAGIEIDSHESDLYVPDSPAVREILDRYPLSKSNARRFANRRPPNIGQIWIDIPFAYLPFWDRKAQVPL